MADEDLALILDETRTVKALKAGIVRSGAMSFAALRPHLHCPYVRAENFPPDCGPSLRKAMFEQTSRLVSLKMLSFTNHNGNYRSLDFRQSQGTGLLKGSSRFKNLHLKRTIQRMEKVDFLWLFENLDSFDQFHGKPDQNPSNLQKVKKFRVE
ncbi:hypothetical protein BGZ79_007952 [Entomortierella chlamydospora]|nr:hypothetical protein BGZ79_007952 [Entomortierella chlamydospora]